MTDFAVKPLRYSIAQATDLLGLSRSTLYTRVATGQLTIHKDGRRTFIMAAELDRYLRTKMGTEIDFSARAMPSKQR